MPLYQINSGNCQITLECPPTIEQELCACIFTAVIQPAQQPAVIHYQISYADGKYRLFRNGRLTHRNKALGKILYALEWQIVNDWVHHQQNCYLLHGAALTWQNQGYLFVGGAGAGKTSFSLFLMQHGLLLLSDEFACLQPPHFQIIPFPRNLVIKPHHHPFLDLSIIPLNSGNVTMVKEGLIVSPTLWGKVCQRPVPLNKIFVLHSNPEDDDFTIAPLSQSAAVMHLVQNAFNPHTFRKTLPTIVSAIVQQAQLFQIDSPHPLSLPPQRQRSLFQEIVR